MESSSFNIGLPVEEHADLLPAPASNVVASITAWLVGYVLISL